MIKTSWHYLQPNPQSSCWHMLIQTPPTHLCHTHRTTAIFNQRNTNLLEQPSSTVQSQMHMLLTSRWNKHKFHFQTIEICHFEIYTQIPKHPNLFLSEIRHCYPKTETNNWKIPNSWAMGCAPEILICTSGDFSLSISHKDLNLTIQITWKWHLCHMVGKCKN